MDGWTDRIFWPNVQIGLWLIWSVGLDLGLGLELTMGLGLGLDSQAAC